MSWPPSDELPRGLLCKQARLQRIGWRHTVLQPGAGGAAQLTGGGPQMPGVGGHLLPWRRQLLAQQIQAAQPDLIEVADPFRMAWAALDAGQRLGVPTLATCHAPLPAMAARWLGGADGTNNCLGRWAARRAQAYLVGLYAGFDAVLAPSRCMTRRLQDWGVLHAQYQPVGVDCTVFTPHAADPHWRRQIEKRLCLARGDRLIVYSGRFSAEKNLDLLADAVALLGPGHVLIATGSGPCPPRGRHVRVLPPMCKPQRLARLLANCDVYAHAGHQEPSGPGVLEAMACGVPVVLSAYEGLGELALQGGFSVARREARDWADTLRFALNRRHGAPVERALAHAHAHDWPRVIKQMLRRYRQLLQQPVKPVPATMSGTLQRLSVHP